MRLLLDTNVPVAAFVARGTCADVLEHSIRSYQPLTSRALLDVIGTAVAGRAAAIITGDRDLLDFQQIGDIVVLAPGDYWRWDADSR